MKRITLRIYTSLLADALEAYFAERPDIPQNTLLIRLLERGLEQSPTPGENEEILTKLEELRTILSGSQIEALDRSSSPEPTEAANGLDAMLGGFESGRR